MLEVPSAYMVVQIEVKNFDDYLSRYATPVIDQLRACGAEILVASRNPLVLEGSWPANWTVVIRFPSLTTAQAWYDSIEYRPLKDLRIRELTNGGSAIFVEGFNPVALGIA